MSETDSLRALREAEDNLVRSEMLAAGIQNDGVQSLTKMDVPLPGIPVLISLMKRVTHPYIKQSVIRALATEAAKGLAEKALIEYFEELPESDWASCDTKWVIGNTLEIISDKSMIDDLIRISMDRRHGKSREMIVYSLRKFGSLEIFDYLLKLLDDPDVYGQAVIALGNTGDPRAIPAISEKLHDEKSWVRVEARKALNKLRRISSKGRREIGTDSD